jgi:hypothetical protein
MRFGRQAKRSSAYEANDLPVGYGARNIKAERALLLVLPFVVSIAFLLIADIDSPRGGLIDVYPQNLMSVSQSLAVH